MKESVIKTSLLGGTDGSTSATLKITEAVTVTFKQVLCNGLYVIAISGIRISCTVRPA